jgi:hypothetical protein
MRVIAEDHDWFVLEVESDTGRVFDLPRRRLFAPMSLEVILARGTWRDFSGDPRHIFDALSDAVDVPSDQLSLTQEAASRPGPAVASWANPAVVVGDRHHETRDVQGMPAEDLSTGAWATGLANARSILAQISATLSERLRRSRSSTTLR